MNSTTCFNQSRIAVKAVEGHYQKAAVMVYPTKRVRRALDEPDNRILECAQAAKAHYLVTGNKKHFPFYKFKGTKIVSPAEFSALLIPGS
jgi:predicted nucleic acid-binding protein